MATIAHNQCRFPPTVQLRSICHGSVNFANYYVLSYFYLRLLHHLTLYSSITLIVGDIEYTLFEFDRK